MYMCSIESLSVIGIFFPICSILDTSFVVGDLDNGQILVNDEAIRDRYNCRNILIVRHHYHHTSQRTSITPSTTTTQWDTGGLWGVSWFSQLVLDR